MLLDTVFDQSGDLATLDPSEAVRTEDVSIGRTEAILCKGDMDAILQLGADVQEALTVIERLPKSTPCFVRHVAARGQAGTS